MNASALLSMFAAVLLGTFISAGCCALGKCDAKTTLDTLPPAVQAAVEKETAGGTIREIERERCHGKTCYEVEYTRDNRNTDVTFAEDGAMVSCDK
ncbi:MAG: PepSY-like domain-containing protein [Lentisphaerae bacterium]|nr:PepSY-like domain-containing protein [Lentisphaerota bacterium]